MVDVLGGAVEVDVGANALEVVDDGVTDPVANGALLATLLVMRVVGAIAWEDVVEMLMGLLTAAAVEREADMVLLLLLLPPVFVALMLVDDDGRDAAGVEILELKVEEAVEVVSRKLDAEDAPGAETKISFCAPGAHPMPLLYPGLTPFGGETLLPVAWFQAIISFAPETHLLASVPQ